MIIIISGELSFLGLESFCGDKLPCLSIDKPHFSPISWNTCNGIVRHQDMYSCKSESKQNNNLFDSKNFWKLDYLLRINSLSVPGQFEKQRISLTLWCYQISLINI